MPPKNVSNRPSAETLPGTSVRDAEACRRRPASRGVACAKKPTLYATLTPPYATIHTEAICASVRFTIMRDGKRAVHARGYGKRNDLFSLSRLRERVGVVPHNRYWNSRRDFSHPPRSSSASTSPASGRGKTENQSFKNSPAL